MASAAVKTGPVPTSGRRASRGPSRGAWFGAALALFLVFSFVALRQEPRPDPGRAIGPLHGEWWLSPLEPAAERRLLQIGADLNQVFALRETSHVWVVGNGGLILHSADAGRTWARQRLVPEDQAAAPAPEPSPEPATVSWRDLLPSHPLEGVLLVALAVERKPGDAGPNSYPEQTTRPEPFPPFPGPTRNTDALGEELRQPQQGTVKETPAPVPPGPPVLAILAHADLLSVHFVNEKNGWVAGRGGALFSTVDGGATWTYRDARVGDADHFMVRSDNAGGISIWGDYGARYSRDEGRQWDVLAFSERPNTIYCEEYNQSVRSVHCFEDFAWVVSNDGRLGRKRASDPWPVQRDIATNVDLHSVSFSDPNRGFIAGAGGTLLASSDGGATWTPLSRPPDGTVAGSHWVFPAPWYFASLLLVGLVLAPAFRRPVVVAPERSVADLLVSDRPIDAGDPDPLDFGTVALGLSRFLRNEKTQPPLTLAVTGEWGSGKSSLMNLLRADLRRYGFRPVWFNAWHHQKEEHLLASLLEAVRSQAVPSKWRPEGMLFRAKLLGIRGVRVWPLIAVLLLAFAVSLGYLRADPGRVAAAHAGLATLAAKAADPIGAFAEWTAGRSAEPAVPEPAPGVPRAPDAPAGRATLFALLLSSAGLLTAAWRGAKAFGVNPASLLNREAGAPRVKDLKDLTSFRHKFAAEFQDVTRALHPRTLLILIDDLDRCRPGNVLEVLEAVNFLVSSGECYVVMGMARERVVRCVGLSFKDVADELLDAPDGGSEIDARRRRFEFAQQYLEKLINIEVPVPVPTGDQARRLLDPIVDAEEPESGSRWRPVLRAVARRALPLAGLVLLLAVGYGLGSRWSPPPAAPSSPLAPAASPAGPSSGPVPSAEAPGEPRAPSRPARFEPGDTVRRSAWLPALLALALLGLGLWRLSVPPDLIVRDSEEFERALAAWHPLVYARRGTPRSVKRFLNRVRYLAMLQRRQAPEPTLWTRLLDRLRGRTPEPAPAGGDVIPERALVALAALEHHRPEWLQDNEIFMDFPGFLRRADLPPEIQKLANDPDWQLPLFHYWPAYLEMSRGLQVS